MPIDPPARKSDLERSNCSDHCYARRSSSAARSGTIGFVSVPLPTSPEAT
jgi:hypothetical protein